MEQLIDFQVKKYQESGERLTAFILASGKTKAEISRITGIPQPTISRIASGDQVLGPGIIKKLTEFFSVNDKWLKTGEGKMGLVTQKPLGSALDQQYDKEDTARVVGVYDPEAFKPVRIIRYRVWASFVDNFDEFDFDDIQDTVQVYLPDLSGPLTEDNLVFEILGDSMETTLLERAKVLAGLVDTGNIEYLNGGVYVIAYRNKLVIKRIIDNDLLINGTLTLYSDNPLRGKITILKDDIRYIWHVTDIIGSKVR